MKLTNQKKLASIILKCSPSKVWVDETKQKEVKEAITKIDIKNLIKEGIIAKKKLPQQSRSRARKIHIQKVKGRQSGIGSRKGKPNARLKDKIKWILKIRSLRLLLKDMKDHKRISGPSYRDLYSKAKGGYFRNKRHVKLYVQEKDLLLNKKK